MKKIILFIALAVALMPGLAATPERPKLVVGIVVDQMRWDYLVRYADRYGEGGFLRMLGEGYSFDNTNIDYIPTVTAIGHSSVYTGSVPAIHGIAGNYFREGNRMVYCTEDSTVQGVGGDGYEGRMSPRRLLTTTVGDELRLATNFRSRVVAVSLKDRASILPGGHTSNGSYWFDGKSGRFITSTFYTDKLPGWVERFNARNLPAKYLDQDWHTLYPIDSYRQSTPDDTHYEGPFANHDKPTFPIRTSKLYSKTNYGVIRTTPYGNTFTFDMAKAAIEGEELGTRGETDMLAISLSATDYVGHQFGVNAIETEDTYLRLDRDMADFFAYLDKRVGKGQYLVFLTADHGAAHNHKFLIDHKIPAGSWKAGDKIDGFNAHLKNRFGVDGLVRFVSNYQIFLNRPLIAERGLDLGEVKKSIMQYAEGLEAVAFVIDQEKALITSVPELLRNRVVNGYNREGSGEVQIILKPGWMGTYGSETGTQHGVWCPYDAHIPLVFMGWHVPHGRTARFVQMTDIAPTVASLLSIQQPNGCIGVPLAEICP